MNKLTRLIHIAVLTIRHRMDTKRSVGFGLGCFVALGLVFGGIKNAQAVTLPDNDTFVLDFIANGNGGGNLSNFPVAVYWKWDGNQTLGIRMETPNTGSGFPGFTANGIWSFNVFCDGSSPGGLNSNGDNTSSLTPISIGTFSAVSLGAYAVPVDAVEATWVQPCGGGPFDPSQTAVYIQLTIGGANFPSDGYRIPDYEAQGGTYSDSPDFFTQGAFCGSAQGICAELTFQVPDPADVLDHFKCYKVDKKKSTKLDPKPLVDLEDQFDVDVELDVKVDGPEFFCNPVSKDGTEILNGFAHQTCYKIKGPKQTREVVINNQFGEQTLIITEPKLLCVPSTKAVIE